MLEWLWDLLKREEPIKKKSKRDHADYVMQISRKSAQTIAELAPRLLEGMKPGDEIITGKYSPTIDVLKKENNDLTLRIAPVSHLEWARYFRVRYNKEDESIIVFGVADKHGEAQVEILKAALGEVVFEYEYDYADDLHAIASALRLADKIQRGILKKSDVRPPKPWIW